MDVANGAGFGLLTGSVSEGSHFNNVKISGKLLFTDNCFGLVSKSDAFSIGLIASSGNIEGISFGEGEVTAEKVNAENESFDIEINEDGSVSLTAGSN
jgi:hypothetical protein